MWEITRKPAIGNGHYHIDWCTKNKRMIWIPTHCLFLTCAESPSLLNAHNIKIIVGA
jgi:hypothetical protein